MTNSSLRTLELHYELFSNDSHSMDALSFNKAEFNLIKAIISLGDYLDAEIKVNVEAKGEGSIKDYLQVIVEKLDLQPAFNVLLGALISTWFRPKIHRTEEIKNRLEIIERIRTNNITPAEAELLLSDDKKLKQWCSQYYKSIQEPREVAQITASIHSEKEQIIEETIQSRDFDDKIISTEETTSTQTIEGTTIHIVSPVLVKVKRSQPWEGIYSGNPIEFKIEDNEFLEQVYNHEIKFGNGTYIICSLSITTLTKIKDDGEIETSHTYVVKEVSQWADDETFQYFTKRYKRKQAEANAPKMESLFSDEYLDGLGISSNQLE